VIVICFSSSFFILFSHSDPYVEGLLASLPEGAITTSLFSTFTPPSHPPRGKLRFGDSPQSPSRPGIPAPFGKTPLEGVRTLLRSGQVL